MNPSSHLIAAVAGQRASILQKEPNRSALPFAEFRAMLRPLLFIRHLKTDSIERIDKIIRKLSTIHAEATQKACHIEWAYPIALVEVMMDKETFLLWKWHILDDEPTFVELLKFLRKRLQMLTADGKMPTKRGRRTGLASKSGRLKRSAPAPLQNICLAPVKRPARLLFEPFPPSNKQPDGLTKRAAYQTAASPANVPTRDISEYEDVLQID